MLPLNKREILNRLKTVRGHVDGIIRMTEEEAYCVDLMKQVSAAQASLERVNRLILKNHLETCFSEAVSEDDPSGIATAAYHLLNLSAGWTVRTGDRLNSIILRVDNALDEKYAEATSRLKAFAFNPGRNFSIVYRVLF